MTEPTAEEHREDVWEFLGRQRVRAWFCPVRSHRTVEWRGDVAHCTHGTCELTSEDTRPWLQDMAEAIAKAEAERDEARLQLSETVEELAEARAEVLTLREQRDAHLAVCKGVEP